jgi:hypothetical protein
MVRCVANWAPVEYQELAVAAMYSPDDLRKYLGYSFMALGKNANNGISKVSFSSPEDLVKVSLLEAFIHIEGVGEGSVSAGSPKGPVVYIVEQCVCVCCGSVISGGELRGGIARKYREKPWEVSVRSLYEDVATWKDVSESSTFVVGQHFVAPQHKRHVMRYTEVLCSDGGAAGARPEAHDICKSVSESGCVNRLGSPVFADQLRGGHVSDT